MRLQSKTSIAIGLAVLASAACHGGPRMAGADDRLRSEAGAAAQAPTIEVLATARVDGEVMPCG